MGDIVNDYGIGDVNFDNLMLSVDAQRIGYNALSLTEYTTVDEPAIAAGSKVEVNGALYSFDSEEAISGSPSDGDVWVKLVPESGTATNSTTNSSGYAINSTVITLASAGTGTILVGDRITFAGDTRKYKITSGDTDVSDGGSITIDSPGILTAIPSSNTAITIYVGKVSAEYTVTAPEYSASKFGWYGVSASANHRYVASLVLDAGEYRNKYVYINLGYERIPMTFATLSEYVDHQVMGGGVTYAFVFTFDWDVDSIVNIIFNVCDDNNTRTATSIIINDIDITDEVVTVTVEDYYSGLLFYNLFCSVTAMKKIV